MIGNFLFFLYLTYMSCAVPISLGYKYSYVTNKNYWAESIYMVASFEYEEECNKELDVCFPINVVSSTGTAFVVEHYKNKTVFMTAAHLCEPERDPNKFKVSIALPVEADKKIYKSKKILYSNKHTDLCVFAVEGKIGRKARLAHRNPRYGEAIYSIGAPAGYMPTSAKPITKGLYSGTAKQEYQSEDGKSTEKVNIYNFNMPTIGGMSGSPIFNDKGQVIGVVSAVLYQWHMVCFSPTRQQVKAAYIIAMENLKIYDPK